jgi:hypothetical protein
MLWVPFIQLFNRYVIPICEAAHIIPVFLFHLHSLQHVGGNSRTAFWILVLKVIKFIMSRCCVYLILYVSPPENFCRYDPENKVASHLVQLKQSSNMEKFPLNSLVLLGCNTVWFCRCNNCFGLCHNSGC